MTHAPAVSDLDPAVLAAAAFDWYATNGRDLAFRRTSDPWAVLVSEVMAQQTQAARAAEAWSGFMKAYATPVALAAASPAEVIRAWRGLGYNRRAVALRAAAVAMVERHDGQVPDSLEALVALPGVGPYTARAILAIAFGRPVAPLDTNVRRVLARSLGWLPGPERELQAVADAFVPGHDPAAWAHALMDIGATLCRKREPRCAECPLSTHCAFLRRDAALAPAPAALEAPQTVSTTTRRRSRAGGQRFELTTRWLRGRILDRLRDAEVAEWVTFGAPLGTHDVAAVGGALSSLHRDGMLELDSTSPLRARLPT